MKPLSIPLVAFALASAIAFAAPGAAAAGSPDAAHGSRNALDWPGTYEGVLPCADCPGITTRVSLRADGSYEVKSTYIDRKGKPRIERGRIAWQPGGNAVKLDGAARGQMFAVGEGRLAWLEPGAAPAWPQPARFVLTRVASPEKAAPSGVQGTLESHRWMLDAAADANGKPIPGLPAETARKIVFSFAGGKLAIEGACNRSFGGYQIDAEGRLVVHRMASTMMACDPVAMKVDDALAALLAEPAKIEVTLGAAPALRLANAQSGTLALSGQLTPEARYGEPTRLFLEVASQTMPCDNPLTGAKACLRVRDRSFDNKGLDAKPPGAWRALYESIEGYAHEVGVRNVLRLKRFKDKQSGSTVYVLDMVVQSESVAR